MNERTAKAYRAWQKAADTGYGSRPTETPSHMERVDRRIRRLKADYERLLAEEKHTKRELDAAFAKHRALDPHCTCNDCIVYHESKLDRS